LPARISAFKTLWKLSTFVSSPLAAHSQKEQVKLSEQLKKLEKELTEERQSFEEKLKKVFLILCMATGSFECFNTLVEIT